MRYAVDGCMTCGNMKLLFNCMNEKQTIVNTNCFVIIAGHVGLDIFFPLRTVATTSAGVRYHMYTHTHTRKQMAD